MDKSILHMVQTRGPLGLLPVGVLLSSADPARPPRRDQADLLPAGGAALHGGGLADMLVVAATVGVLHGVHRHTAHLVSGVRGPQGQGGEVVTVAAVCGG